MTKGIHSSTSWNMLMHKKKSLIYTVCVIYIYIYIHSYTQHTQFKDAKDMNNDYFVLAIDHAVASFTITKAEKKYPF